MEENIRTMDDNSNMFEEKKVFVKIGSDDISPELLKTVFRNYGSIDVHHKGAFAIVEFASKTKAESAIKDIGNKPPLKLNLSMARKKNYYNAKPEAGRKGKWTPSKSDSTSDNKVFKNRNKQSVSSPNSVQSVSRANSVHSGSNANSVQSVSNANSVQSGSNANSVVSKSSSSNASVVLETPPDCVTLLLEQMGKTLFANSKKSVKECILTLTKCFIEENVTCRGKPQYKEDLLGKIQELFDDMTLSNRPDDKPTEPHSSQCKRQTPLKTLTIHSEESDSDPVPNTSTIKHTKYVKSTTPIKKTHVVETSSSTSSLNKAESASKTPSSPSLARNFSAWLSTPGKAMTLKMSAKKDKGIICLAMDVNDPAMQAKYESLFDEFAACCGSAKGTNISDTHQDSTMMAVEVSKDVWYRAFRCSEGWALLDEGTIALADKVLQVILCPEKYKNIPEFACYFMCDPVDKIKNVDINLTYHFDFVSKSIPDNTLFVKVYDEKKIITINGLIKPWELTSNTRLAVAAPQPKTEIEPTKVVEGLKRISVVDKVNIGDELQLTMVVSESLGQVCIMYNRNDATMVKQFESLLQEFAEACEKEKVSPVVSGKVMGVRLIADQGWYRSVSVSGGWALLDEGHTVTLDKVDKCVLCPRDYYNVPEFCVLLTNALSLKPDIFYSVKIINKEIDESKAKVKVFIPNDPSSETCGYMIPFAQFREEQTMAQLLDEKVNNAMIMSTVKVSCLSKLNIKPGSQVVIVHHIKDKIFLRQNGDNAKEVYLELLDKLTLSGPKLSAVSGNPEKDDLVVCKYGNQYHRAVVDKYYSVTNKCDLVYMDIGCKESVSCSMLKIVPVWATEVPIMTEGFSLSGVESEAMSSAITAMYISSLIDLQTTLTCVEVSLNQVVLETSQTRQNVNEKIVDVVTPNWKKIVKRGSILKEPVIMEQDMKYIDIKKGQELKILHELDCALSVSVVGYKLETKLKDLTQEFSEYCDAMKDAYLPRIEELCFYKDDEDGSWRRGCVLQISDKDIVSVSSLDYGGPTKVHFSKCRKMLKEFSETLPFLAVYVTISEIGPEPSDAVFNKTCELLKNMDSLIIESAICSSLGVYDIKIKGLADKLRAERII